MTNNIEAMKLALDALEYRDGVLYWKESRGCKKAGSPAGTLNTSGYLQLMTGGKHYLNHRLIWLMYNDELPISIDHINGDRTDNRIENLRAATLEQNNHNRKLQASNKSGIKGVSWQKTTGKWFASIKVNGKSQTIGRFSELQDAANAISKFREQLHGEYANHG